eukprot:5297348-Alexandrium_andersonii.AAC.1
MASQDAAATLWSERLLGWLRTACVQLGAVVVTVTTTACIFGSMFIEVMTGVISAPPAWYGCTAGARGHAARARTRARESAGCRHLMQWV